MKFIGRKQELETLQCEYDHDSSFVVIYGRRRVGKTTLIKEFVKDKNALYYLATEEVESLVLSHFASSISKFTEQQYLKNAKFTNWYDLFDIIINFKKNEKKIIVIDEFPYLVKVNSAIPSIFQKIWDERLKDNNIMLILCGSFISMMKKYTLNYDSPLYGRRTAQIRLMPLSFMEIHSLSNDAFTSSVEKFSITGGVPKYLEFFNNSKSLKDNITETVLFKNSFLYEEPLFLLKEETRDPASYFSIIKTIADGNHKIGNIASILEIESKKLSPYLKTLIDIGFLEKQVPITEKDFLNSRKGLYFISDNFMKFWFKYVYPFRDELEFNNMDIVFEELDKDFITSFVAFSYEDICKNIFVELCKNKIISFTLSKIGSYWLNDYGKSDTQIDVMALDNRNKIVFAGECKYHMKPVDADVFFDLQRKIINSNEINRAFKNYKFIYGIFSKSGFTKRLLDINDQNEDLFLINECEVIAPF